MAVHLVRLSVYDAPTGASDQKDTKGKHGMKIICKVEGAECPNGLKICCGVCDHRGTCPDVCGSIGMISPQNCDDAEVITDEVVQFESAVPDVIWTITTLKRKKQELENQEKALNQKLVEAMEQYGVKSFENDVIKMTYVAPTTRSTIDSTKLKKDHPDIAEQYTKISKVSASVRVTLK